MAAHGDLVEDQIRDAMARGEFENLPGAGKPLDLGDDDEAWWVKRRLAEMRRRDGLEAQARGIADLEEALWRLPDVAAVKARVAEINLVIGELNAELDEHDRLSTLDTNQAVATWNRMFRLRG